MRNKYIQIRTWNMYLQMSCVMCIHSIHIGVFFCKRIGLSKPMQHIGVGGRRAGRLVDGARSHACHCRRVCWGSRLGRLGGLGGDLGGGGEDLGKDLRGFKKEFTSRRFSF